MSSSGDTIAGLPKAVYDEIMNHGVGIIFITMITVCCLFGVTTTQTTYYFRHYPKDRPFIRFLVISVWVLDCFHLCLAIRILYNQLVKGHGFFPVVFQIDWTGSTQILANSITVISIQWFYTYRVWALSKSKPLIAFLVTITIAAFCMGVVVSAKNFPLTSTEQVGEATGVYVVAMDALMAFADCMLTISLSWYLTRSQVTTVDASRLVRKLLFYTINTGVLTSVFAVIALMMNRLLPTYTLYIFFYDVASRLYSVTFLSVLNARDHLRADYSGEYGAKEVTFRNISGTDRMFRLKHTASRPQQISVSVHHSTDIKHDS